MNVLLIIICLAVLASILYFRWKLKQETIIEPNEKPTFEEKPKTPFEEIQQKAFEKQSNKYKKTK